MHTLVETMKQVLIDAGVMKDRDPQVYRLLETVFSDLLFNATMSPCCTFAGYVTAFGYLDTNSINTLRNRTDRFAPFLEPFIDSGENETLIKQAATQVPETFNQLSGALCPSVMSTQRGLC